MSDKHLSLSKRYNKLHNVQKRAIFTVNRSVADSHSDGASSSSSGVKRDHEGNAVSNNEVSQSGQAISKQPSVGNIQPVGLPTLDSIDDPMALPGTAHGQASGGASSEGTMAYYIDRPFSSFGHKESVYTKLHKVMTFGLAPTILTVSPAVNRWMTTYLAEIPWHIPAFYLNPSEYSLLPNGTHVKSLHIEAIYRGSTIQFETAASVTQLATLNQINDIAVAHALNKTGWGSDVSFDAFQNDNPMVPTAIDLPKYDAKENYRGMTNDYYGTNNDNINFSNYLPHHQISRQTFLYNYWAMSTRTASGSDVNNLHGGWYPLSEKIKQMDGKTVVNTSVLTSEYKPKMGWLKQPLQTVNHGLPFPNSGVSNSLGIPCGGNLVNSRRAVFTRTSTNNPNGIEANLNEDSLIQGNDWGPAAAQVPLPTIYTPIEKSQVSRSGYWGEQDVHIQPSVHIGVQPVPALNTGALTNDNTGTNAWTNCRAYWEIKATMVVTEHLPTELPYAVVPNVPLGDNIIALNGDNWPGFNKDPRNQGATFCGLYPTSSVPI